MLIFGLDKDPRFVAALAAQLDRPVSPHELRRFDDGECKLRPLVDPCGADVYVVHSLHGEAGDSPHDKLVRLLMFVAALRDHGAAQVTAVVPYMAYARKDRRTKPWDPLGLRYVAQMIECVGVDAVMAFEVHNVAAFENAFRRPTVHLEAHPVYDAVALDGAARGRLAVASPDPGGVKRAQLWHEHLEQRLGRAVGFAFCDKRRSGGQLGGTDLVAGDVAGATVLLIDDLIVSGRTLQRAGQALRNAGAQRIVACAAHALFSEEAAVALGDDAIDEIVVTDSVPAPPAGGPGPWEALHRKLRVVSCVAPFAAALRRGHEGWRR